MKKDMSMFSSQQKRDIATAISKILRDTDHPELPLTGQPIHFVLHVDGDDPSSWAVIRNNEDVLVIDEEE